MVRRVETGEIYDEDDDNLSDGGDETFRKQGGAQTARDQFVSTLSRLRPMLKQYNMDVGKPIFETKTCEDESSA